MSAENGLEIGLLTRLKVELPDELSVLEFCVALCCPHLDGINRPLNAVVLQRAEPRGADLEEVVAVKGFLMDYWNGKGEVGCSREEESGED